ncbi:MAG TPA: restriction endonuclease subunit S [Methylotenera sp.]
MKLKPYSSYKDSGVHWLGQIPEEWSTWKISHAFGSVGSGTTPPSNEQEWYENGNIPWITTGELRENIIFETVKFVTPSAFKKFSTLRLHPAGSLAIAMYGATIGRLGILGVDATTNQACCVIGYPKYLDIKFMFYWFLGFKQKIVDLYATGGGQPNINQETIVSLRIPAPCLDDQTDIAAFLDRETGKLDTLIAKQEQLIELLQEKRLAIISHAVTKGLNPDVTMKDSGVKWLGMVPSSWSLIPFKYIVTLAGRIGFRGYTTEDLVEDGEGAITLSPSNLINGQVITDKCTYISWHKYNESPEIQVKYGDVIMVKTGSTYGKVAMVRNPNMLPSTINPQLVIFKNIQSDKTFLYYLLSSTRVQAEIEVSNTGSTIPTMTQETIGNIRIALPTSSEQVNISSYLDYETAKIDILIDKAKRSIELAKEHRSALISAAVTGKIDVREAA